MNRLNSQTKKITVLIPCFNEEAGIASVIAGFGSDRIRSRGYNVEVVVIDNNSKDHTADVARAAGATVLFESKKGKGNAMRQGFFSIKEDTDYVVMLDGDDTYRPEEMLRLIELLDSDFCDVAIGSRLGGRVAVGSMRFTNRVGNWVFSHLVRYFYRVNVTDVLTGYFAWKREALEKMRPHLESQGFAIEMEMVTKMAKLGIDMYCVPITYTKREGESNLRPFRDGSRILWMFFKNLFWTPRKPGVHRIAFVSDAVMPWHKGGKEKRLYEISRRLVKDHQEVHIYTMKWWNGPSQIEHEGVHYHAICKLRPLYIKDRRSIGTALYFSVAVFKLLFEKFDTLDVDHIPFFPLFSARIVATLRRKKLIATWHEVWGKEYWLEYLKGPAGYFGFVVEYLSFRLPDLIISNSEHTTRRLIEVGVGDRVKTVTLGVDIDNILSAEPSHMESDAIYVGRLLNHKGADSLILATAIIKKTWPLFKVIIVGDGPERKNLEGLVDQLGLRENVHILGRVETDNELYGLMKSSKMLVLPSVREGFGLVIAQANAAGIPAITTSHKDNAARDLIREGINGILSEPTATDLANKIIHVMNIHETMQPRADITRYDWHVVAENLAHAIQNIETYGKKIIHNH